MNNYANYLYIAIRAALDAGKAIMDIYTDPESDFGIERKADNSPLTKADKKAHAIISMALSVTPFPVLSEEGKAYHLKPRDILLVSQGAIHKPEIDPSVPYERYIFWIRDDLSCQELNTCFQKANDRSFNLVRADSALQERLKDLLPEIEQTLQNKHFGDTVLRNALFTQFMIYINRIFLRTSSSPDKKTYSSDTQVEQLLKYINRNLSENLSIDQLANRFFFSKYHMMRKFKNETGYTIHNYITSKRLLMARSLISQGMPVMKAAQASGFHDYTTFVRAYKKQFGKAPSCE